MLLCSDTIIKTREFFIPDPAGDILHPEAHLYIFRDGCESVYMEGLVLYRFHDHDPLVHIMDTALELSYDG